MLVNIRQDTPWSRAYEEALVTVGKDSKGKEPSLLWRYKMLIAEHSPIKLVEYTIKFKSVRVWIFGHLVRHAWLLPFIKSQRADRNGNKYNRDELPQGAPNDGDFVANAQTLINMSRRRLCRTSDPKTVATWQKVVDEMQKTDPVMARAMVPNCVYSGFCRDVDNCCGYVNTEAYKQARADYIDVLKK